MATLQGGLPITRVCSQGGKFFIAAIRFREVIKL